MSFLGGLHLTTLVWSFVQFEFNSKSCAFAAVVVVPEANSSSEQVDFTDIFNEHRQNVIPPAANMMLLNWNDELAEYSANVSGSCSWVASGPQTTGDEYMGFQVEVPPGDDIKDYIVKTLNDAFASCKNGSCEEYYLNTLWHGIREIGCSAENCSNSKIEGHMVVCYYDVEPDVDSLESAYTVGTPCTDCPGDFGACDKDYSLCIARVPTTLRIITQPGPNATKAGQQFASKPKIEILDENGDRFTGKKNPACHYEVWTDFSLRSHHEARLRGKDTVKLIDGVAVFPDLGISEYGEYILKFSLDAPNNDATTLSAESELLQIAMPPDTYEECKVEEGDPQFERQYHWTTSNCSEVCIENCKGQNSECFDLDGCGPHSNCLGGECVCKQLIDIPVFKFNSESLAEMLRPCAICEPNRVAIRLDKCGLNAIGYTLKGMYLLGTKNPIQLDDLENIDEQLHPYVQTCAYNDCRGHVTALDDGLQYEFGVSGNFGDCHAEVIDNGTHITYKHRVRGYGGFSGPVISRKRSLAVDFSCTYVKTLTTSLDFGIDVFLGLASIEVQHQGNFDVEIAVYENSAYSQKYTSPPTILVPDVVYVGVQLKGLEATEVILYADYCYATPTEDPDDEISVDLIKNGCSNGSDVTVAQNGEGKEVFFSFYSFRFADQPDNTEMYVHCTAVVCMTEDDPACSVSCGNRRKRAAGADGSSSNTVSIGPLSIESDDTSRTIGEHDRIYSSYFATQELANPPAARTSGIPNVEVNFT